MAKIAKKTRKVVAVAKKVVARPVAKPVPAKPAVKTVAKPVLTQRVVTANPVAVPLKKDNKTEIVAREKLQRDLTAIAYDLFTAETILEEANQASIWQNNALAASDSFVEPTRFKALIDLLESAHALSDKVRDLTQSLVSELREKRRSASKALGHHANDAVVAVMHEEEEAKVAARIKQVNADFDAKKNAPTQTAKPVARPVAATKPASKPATQAVKPATKPAQAAPVAKNGQKVGFRAFIESRGHKWPMTAQHPKWNALKVAYAKAFPA